MRSERAILNDILPTCVCRCISSYLARALCSQIKRSLKSIRLNVLVELLKNHSCLTSNYRADLVKSLDFVHVLEVYDDLVENWHTSAHQTSVSSLRNNC